MDDFAHLFISKICSRPPTFMLHTTVVGRERARRRFTDEGFEKFIYFRNTVIIPHVMVISLRDQSKCQNWSVRFPA